MRSFVTVETSEKLLADAGDVLQRQLDMPGPPAGWELIQALEANGFTIGHRYMRRGRAQHDPQVETR